ncbi:gamma-glutamyl-gamma-aminobutyrate hydrolase family protein [Piscinibacter koreensis]|uniref:Gamma-glutamyl-gamma-aminobutyrate hydrolase family protein n=1 Tax=Piscinibacter koreensis TaxID=2742824 RepID=A0A7Y6NML6_9BURK|nr:gamma-glutamyl-gamma-aminobutyrate hydrolase family protein [Schlegelella koreensis]NUZ05842.1 gamma-glutamyl-gamma-aminobutyrate hydrolase family protein [Schlegelella koreensis]
MFPTPSRSSSSRTATGCSDSSGATSSPSLASTRCGAARDAPIEPDGVLDALLGEPVIDVDSLHGQVVDRLASGLRVEARGFRASRLT